MTSKTNKDFGPAFDCSGCQSYGNQVPHFYKGYHLCHPLEMKAKANEPIVHVDGKAFNFSVVTPKQSPMLTESSGGSSTEDYSAVEFSNMSVVNQNDLEDLPRIGNELNVRDISVPEDTLQPQWPSSIKTFNDCEFQKIEEWIYSAEKLSPEETFWKETNARKRSLCRYFMRGYCKRGAACDFLHDQSIFCHVSQKVFLGGLPAHMTELTLRQKLAQLGYRVINKPKILGGFAPQVCMASTEEAEELIAKKRILIEGSFVDVRAYETSATGNIDKMHRDENERSVFLGGLTKGTTSEMIKDDLEKMNVQVVNNPLVKIGFTPKVTLAAVKEKKKLLKLKKVWINNTLVDVRAFKWKNPSSSNRIHK